MKNLDKGRKELKMVIRKDITDLQKYYAREMRRLSATHLHNSINLEVINNKK